MDPLSEQPNSVSSLYFHFSSTDASIIRQNLAATCFVTPLLIAFVVFGLIGNLIILLVICTVRRFNRAENLMLANLSVSSILLMFCTVSLYIQMTFPLNIYGPFYCKIYACTHSFMVTAQGFTMICISLERTERVRFPLIRATKLLAVKKIGIIWSLALLCEMPRGFFYRYDPNMTNLMKCYNTKEIFGSLVPFAIYMTTSYIIMYLLPSFWLGHDWIRLVSQLRFLVACQTLPMQTNYRKRQKKLIGHAIIFTSIFIAIKVPCGTHALFYQLPPQLLSESVVGWVKNWEKFFFSAQVLHGSFYPFIIYALSGDIRKYLLCYERNRRHQTDRLALARIT